MPMALGLGLGLPYLGAARGPYPALDLNFISGALDSRITFSRGSSGTRVNSSGVLETITSGNPRFTYDPVTLSALGLLIEEQRSNRLLWSEDFTNAAWVKTRATVTANTAVAPDGNTTADTLTATGANATIVQSITPGAGSQTQSIYLMRKTGTGNIDVNTDGATWVTQTLSSVAWTRCVVTQTCGAGALSAGVRIVTSGDEVYAWGAQHE